MSIGFTSLAVCLIWIIGTSTYLIIIWGDRNGFPGGQCGTIFNSTKYVFYRNDERWHLTFVSNDTLIEENCPESGIILGNPTGGISQYYGDTIYDCKGNFLYKMTDKELFSQSGEIVASFTDGNVFNASGFLIAKISGWTIDIYSSNVDARFLFTLFGVMSTHGDRQLIDMCNGFFWVSGYLILTIVVICVFLVSICYFYLKSRDTYQLVQ